MNDLEQLRERLANRFPDALLAIDVPAADTGGPWVRCIHTFEG